MFFFLLHAAFAGHADLYMKKGWEALVKDKDTTAIRYFELAYEAAEKEQDIKTIATAQLNLGICYYGMSHSKGLEYCFAAMRTYKKLETTDPQAATLGRCKCLQLISTIYSRQEKFSEALALSREALYGFLKYDSSGYTGLAYSSIGIAYEHLHMTDSAGYYYSKALEAQLGAKNFAYLPGAFVKAADLELQKGNQAKSLSLYTRALQVADSTANHQAQAVALLGMGKWSLAFGKKDNAEAWYKKAIAVAAPLSDKTFYLLCMDQLLELKKRQGSFEEALHYHGAIDSLKKRLEADDKSRLVKSLEIQFHVAEKDRKLVLLQKEKDITRLHNYLLWGTVTLVILIAAGVIGFLRRINSRDKLLLQTKGELFLALEEQKKTRELYLHNELEHKESQLSAMALQMYHKNELMQQMKQQAEQDSKTSGDDSLSKLLNKEMNYDKKWSDFNLYFESVNKNFYSRLKQNYPDISPNDLKICALIKLNLSIKEMAGILNISPDSVKTARYRLRKKLQLGSEENLTEFMIKL